MSYQLLKELIEFSIKIGNEAKAIAELVSRPPSLVVHEADVAFLVQHKERIFAEPMEDDVDYSRCRPPNVRRKEQLTHQTAKAIKSA